MKGYDMGDIVKQAQQMQKKIAKLKEDLKERVVEGTAGGNMVKVLVNGEREVLKVEIQPEVVDEDDVEMLQDLILAATNQALKKAQQMQEEEMGKLTGGMGLSMPGLF
ncbi:MAG: YbaB/EbfC family nucleoid-associated protein [Planctomycetota bacterium]|nr:MAG: YbaB/EbfC family nucleoid-associated protein [Planctomycetota bacterium]